MYEDIEKIKKSLKAFDLLLDELQKIPGTKTTDFIFLLDGMRPQLYNSPSLENAAHSFFGILRNHVITESPRRGFEVIDLQSPFLANYKKNQQVFEFPTDGHWNARGHQIAARELLQSGWLPMGDRK